MMLSVFFPTFHFIAFPHPWNSTLSAKRFAGFSECKKMQKERAAYAILAVWGRTVTDEIAYSMLNTRVCARYRPTSTNSFIGRVLYYRTSRWQFHRRYDGRLTQFPSTYAVELRRVWPISWCSSSGRHGFPEVQVQHGGAQISHCAVSDPPLWTLVRAGGLLTRLVQFCLL